MSAIKKFIYSKKEDGVYIKRTIFGINITTKIKNLPFKENRSETNIFEIYKNPNYTEKKYKLAMFCPFGIGDYILFRKFLPYIKDYYKEYNIAIIGNGQFADILKYFDSEYIDEYISYLSSVYSIDAKAVEEFFANREYDILIFHFYGRAYNFDMMIKSIKAKEKIASYGSLWHNSRYLRALSFEFYTRLISNNDNIENIFEFERNRHFFEELLNRKIDINDMNIELDKSFFNKIDFDFNLKYCIIFPCSPDKKRGGDNRMFAEIIDYLYSKYEITSYIVGSKDNILEADDIVNNCSYTKYAKNICGKYKLNELFYIFNKAKLIISVDSAGYHMGISVNDNVIVISSGMSYNRYLQYPKELIKNKNINIVLPKELEKDIKNKTEKFDYEYYPLYDIKSITSKFVCGLIDDKYALK